MHTRAVTPNRVAVAGGFLLLAGLSLVRPAAALDGEGTLRIAPENGWKAFEVISQGDDPGGDGLDYAMPGTFDGAGAYLVDASTLRVIVNHETGDASISEVDLDLAQLEAAIQSMIDTDALAGQPFVVAARQAYARWSSDAGASWTETSSASNTSFERFCSGQAFAPDSFGADRGFVDHVYLTGEEVGGGRLFALDLLARDLYQLSGVVGAAPGGLGGIATDSWENAALIDTGETEHVALLLSPDGGTSTLQLYVGHKGKGADGQPAGDFLARNGLAYGSRHYLGGSLPDAGGTNQGDFQTNLGGALTATKMEDVDTSPSDPTRVVLGNQNYGTFVLDFDLDFRGGFDPEGSSFTITEIADQGGGDGLDSADNVDWTAATVLGGVAHPDGLIFVNEDNSSGQIWQLEPDGSDPIWIASTTVSAESTGIFDLSSFVGYAPGSVLITNNQGSASMTVLIHPEATAAAVGACGDLVCDGNEDAQTCPDDCAGGDGDGDGDGDPTGDGDGDPATGDGDDPTDDPSGDGDSSGSGGEGTDEGPDSSETGDESGSDDAGIDGDDGCNCRAPAGDRPRGWLGAIGLVGLGLRLRRRGRRVTPA